MSVPLLQIGRRDDNGVLENKWCIRELYLHQTTGKAVATERERTERDRTERDKTAYDRARAGSGEHNRAERTTGTVERQGRRGCNRANPQDQT